ncbi:hypothetical protein DFR45_1237, partial [Extensimonas vulgaris]
LGQRLSLPLDLRILLRNGLLQARQLPFPLGQCLLERTTLRVALVYCLVEAANLPFPLGQRLMLTGKPLQLLVREL